MDDLPPAIVLEILNRLNDFVDLARCRLASKTLNALSYDVRSLKILCSFDRYLKSKVPATKSSITPFKTIVKNLVLNLRNIEFITIGVEKPFRGIPDDDADDESDDLYLTTVNFVSQWLPAISGQLKSLAISDFWIQSCWRRSEVLSLISSYCHSLLELEVKNAWLSVEGLKSMQVLTSLTLEFIRLDDEDLDKVNECFPSLQVLNLIGVGGLRNPRVHLLQLKKCRWTVSNAPLSLTIDAPNLVELDLKCVKPDSLVIEAPLLAALNLSIEKAANFGVKCLPNLTSLQIESTHLSTILVGFPDGKTVEKLVVDSPRCANSVDVLGKVDFDALMGTFPNVRSLTLGPGAWSELEVGFSIGGLEGGFGVKALQQIVVHLEVTNYRITGSFISSILGRCPNLLDVVLIVDSCVESEVVRNLMSMCIVECPRVRWRLEHGKSDQNIMGF
ncbi:PREDICTED: F-box/LRR-repeat protein At4g29420 [Nelumbo nucifera]|uniref:F-box/LRR-repeat protein At4g29420 n=2 Tax=Nelumbo nucifera TaxID=4432 RepID=A0A1U8AV07_NELNU|nr:PREDICTED: F-box/LRR-repeat protein At4g29420 [Nelumbo nucifera]DAD48932.1 TPA_asm: hypothetical protein HUJ06_018869 [Nelumbo nucifera]